MVIVRIIGGLGNQMFQYAYAKSLQERGYKVKIDISKFKKYKLHGGYQLDKFNIDIKPSTALSNFLSKLGVRKSIKEKNRLFNENLLVVPKKSYLKGYFQTERYFQNIRSILEKEFTLLEPISYSSNQYKNEIEAHANSCSLHVRRGDYISNKKANKVHGTCDLNYYKRAIEFIESQYKNIHFFIFSDDLNWVKNNLKLKNGTYIDHDVIPHEDLYLMSLCRFNITANSSFSWWGAWLNKHKNKMVISPKKWYVSKETNIICNDWIKL